MIMQCGHAPNAKNSEGDPVCVICVGIHPGWNLEDKNPPSFSGREACCAYASPGKYGPSWKGETRGGRHCVQPSNSSLPFFESRPNDEFDYFYCGCFGWD